jgi:hypothetical protein
MTIKRIIYDQNKETTSTLPENITRRRSRAVEAKSRAHEISKLDTTPESIEYTPKRKMHPKTQQRQDRAKFFGRAVENEKIYRSKDPFSSLKRAYAHTQPETKTAPVKIRGGITCQQTPIHMPR